LRFCLMAFCGFVHSRSGRATGETQDKERLLALSPSVRRMPADQFGKLTGFTLVRVLSRLDDKKFKKAV
jgi:hypothetical protein